MKEWFTSDTHFGSKITLELGKRPFINISAMDNFIIDNWNSKIEKSDVVYHLGDFGNYDVLNLLNGKVILIMGNYEFDDMNKNFNGDFDTYSKYLKNKGFLDVSKGDYKYNLIFEDNVEEINCCHKPANCNKEYFNLFGHIHALQMVKKYGLNVGVDAHHFYPIDVETIIFYKRLMSSYYDEYVFN